MKSCDRDQSKGIVQDCLRQLRSFYADEKSFSWQRLFLIKGITNPARWLNIAAFSSQNRTIERSRTP